MHKEQEIYDVVVMGGGLSGFCAAVAAARSGAKTCLIQNRPVLGGNASSEIRVTVHGAACHHAYARETGILGEAMRAERAANHLFPNENGWTNSVFDMTLYDIAMQERNLHLHLNTDVWDVELADGTRGREAMGDWPRAHQEHAYWSRPACQTQVPIQAVYARVQNAEVEHRIEGKQFIDCTGDALPAHLAGCSWRMGSESRTETGELHAPESASTDTMGNSIHIRCIDTGRPAPFAAPAWAMHYDNADFFYKQGRVPNDPQGGFWWIEIGVPWDTITENETIRHELTRHALGVWHWMKNHDPIMKEKCRNYALEFIGQVPGKRESRRVMGLHFLKEQELQQREVFPDTIAFGGWFIDLHTPGGLLAPSSEPSSAQGYDHSLKDVALKYIGPYGIPLRSLISRDVPNLMMAGRNISVSHAALGTVRVMATCGLMGQAAGTAAARCVQSGKTPAELVKTDMPDLQAHLQREGCFLPGISAKAWPEGTRVTASSSLTFSGLGAWEKDPDTGLRDKIWDRCLGRSTPLNLTPCNWIFLDGQQVDTIRLHLQSDTGGTGSVHLRKVPNIWSYAPDDGEQVWETPFTVPAGFDGLHELSPNLKDMSAGCYRLEVRGDADVSWRMSGLHPWGLVGGCLIGSGRFHWNRLPGEYAFQISPPQQIYTPQEILGGTNRPQGQSHAWFASGPLPQWAEVTLPSPREVQEVILEFPDQMVLELHWEGPFYVAPHIARRYEVLCFDGNTWETIASETQNRQGRRKHTFSPRVVERIRVQIQETHGGPAGLCALRV